MDQQSDDGPKEETVKLGVSESNRGTPQAGQVLSLRRQNTPSMTSISGHQMDQLPKNTGVNILTDVKTIQDIMAKLEQMGIQLRYLLYFAYSDKQVAALMYCVTIHGQYVIVEPPPNIIVQNGTMSVNFQRVGVLPTNIIEQFASELSTIYTGYAYICGGGIHYVKSPKAEPVFYGYDDYPMAKAVFDIKKYHYILIPAVPFVNLIEPARLNTIEAYINAVSGDDILQQVMVKSGLEKLFTMKGPFTVFMPNSTKLAELLSMDSDKLKAIILAHVIIGRIESIPTVVDKSKQLRSSTTTESLTDPNSMSVLGSETLEFTSIAQNKIIVQKLNGVITKVSSAIPKSNTANSNQVNSSSVRSAAKKYNGILYIIDTVFSPINDTFRMPEKSDIDDVVTVFDINKSTMEIRRAQYAINSKNQQSMFEILVNIGEISAKLNSDIINKSFHEGQNLLQDSNLLLNMFYTREVPCSDLCVEMDQVAETVKKENEEFENILRVSNKLAAMKVPLEKVLLKLARMDQKLHIKEQDPYTEDK